MNHILEDMLRMYCMNNPIKWKDYLHLIEFTYNNAFQKSLKMTPFEALYGQKCRTPASWDNLKDRITTKPKLLKDMKA